MDEITNISPLGLLIEMSYDYTMLKVRYRMCPAIAAFLAEHYKLDISYNPIYEKADESHYGAITVLHCRTL